MKLKSRNFMIWAMSLTFLMIIFVVYNYFAQTPTIQVDTTNKQDVISQNFGNNVGMIGDVGIKGAKNSRYSQYSNNKLMGEFGFAKLLHKTGDEWQIDKPYRNIYREKFNCYITADTGSVSVDSSGARPTPQDATLTGNVVIHIVPQGNSDIQECAVYLDDIIFISEKSMFTTAGPVEYVSKSAKLTGHGLELIYNEETETLEFLKIRDLERLVIKTSKDTNLISKSETQTDLTQQAETASSTENIAKESKNNTIAKTQDNTKEKLTYKCILSDNVAINTPQQLIIANQIFINNIIFAKGSENNQQDTQAQTQQQKTGDANAPAPAPIQYQPAKPDQKDYSEIVVTCDGGIVVCPSKSTLKPVEIDSQYDLPATKNTDRRVRFASDRIHYDLATEDVNALGHSELRFFANDIFNSDSKSDPAPIVVTSEKSVKFDSAKNQAIFSGNSLCKMVRNDVNTSQQYALSAPIFTVYLTGKTDAADIKHITAAGGVVQLSTSKWAEKNLIGFTKLRCTQFDYDPIEPLMTAKGPGLIAVDNSKIDPIQKKDTSNENFSLKKPCWAAVEDFDILNYYPDKNLITFDAEKTKIRIGYVPIIDGQYGQTVRATAGNIVVNMTKDTQGRSSVKKLVAKKGVTYEEEATEAQKKKGKETSIYFAGTQLNYLADQALITVFGDDRQPCLLNGAKVDSIKYDLNTKRAFKAKLVAPGVVQ